MKLKLRTAGLAKNFRILRGKKTREISEICG
jgi:hypothetical protein